MLTEGKRMTVEEYSPNVQSSSNSGSVVLHPPPSPLSEAIKRSKITLTPDDQYLIKANSGKLLYIGGYTKIDFWHLSPFLYTLYFS